MGPAWPATIDSVLLTFLRGIAPMCEGQEDTITLANSDNLVGDLAFYQNVQATVK